MPFSGHSTAGTEPEASMRVQGPRGVAGKPGAEFETLLNFGALKPECQPCMQYIHKKRLWIPTSTKYTTTSEYRNKYTNIIYIYIYIHICIHMYAYVHTYIHLYTYMYRYVHNFFAVEQSLNQPHKPWGSRCTPSKSHGVRRLQPCKAF